MKKIVHVAAEIEPLELHGLASGEVFGVHVALEVQEAGATPDIAEPVARAEFEAFLETLAEGSFHLIAIRRDNNALEPPLPLDLIPYVGAVQPGEIQSWLEDCKAAFKDAAKIPPEEEFEFFSTSEIRNVAGIRTAHAVDLLRATAKWPAPLAQRNGLTVVLTSPHARDPVTHRYAVLFVPQDQAINDLKFAFIEADDELACIGVDAAAGDRLFELWGGVILDYEPANDFFEVDGRVRPAAMTDGLRRLMVRIEEQAPSLLSLSSALVDSLDDKEFLADVAGLPRPEPIKDDTMLPIDARLWLERAAVAALFDVAMVALRYPTPNASQADTATSRNEILLILCRSLASRFEQDMPVIDVDEATLYANLHAALDTALATLDGAAPPTSVEVDGKPVPQIPSTWTSIQRCYPRIDELPALDTLFRTVPPGGAERWADWAKKVVGFTADLSKLAVFLESEAGLEAWLLAFCDEVFKQDGVFRGGLLVGTGILADDTKPDTTEIARATDVYSQFRRFVEGDFNAAESVRRDFGKRIVERLVDDGVTSPDVLKDRLDESHWFKQRVHPAAVGAETNGLLDALVPACPPMTGSEPVPPAVLDDMLKDMFARRAAQITGATASGLLFRPDAAPHPLPIQVTASADPAIVEKASARISGLGFLVRSVAGNMDQTVHASLTQLLDRKSLPEHPIEIAGKTVLPTLPALNNGTSGLFVSYEGVPLSTENRPLPGRDGAYMNSQQLAEQKLMQLVRGYQLAEARYTDDNGDSPRLPALAYGRKYGVTAYWLPGSGIMPAALRGQDGPYVPGPVHELAAAAAFLPEDDALEPYLRRTAISDMSIRPDSSGKNHFSIPEKVFPLAKDDPRLVIENFVGGRLHLDLFRLGDGTGGIEAGVEEIKLFEAAISGPLDLGELDITQMQAIDGALVPTPVTSQAVLADRTLTITLEKLADPARFWLRLAWKTEAAGAGGLSFSDPLSERAQGSSDRAGAVLLLAPKQGDWSWRDAQTLVIDTPRVSYPDFECWARNLDLWNRTARGDAGDNVTTSAATIAKQAALFRALSWAQALFEGAGHDYAEKIKRLPDPAVKAVLVSVAASDQVFGNLAAGGKFESRLVEINPYDAETLPIPPTFKIGEDNRQEETKVRIKELCKLVDEILKRASVEIAIACESKAADGKTVNLPRGWVHRILVAPAVRSKHLESFEDGGVFDPHMTDLAIGEHGDWTIFDGAKFFVETAAPLAHEMMPPDGRINVSSLDVSRSFKLQFNLKLADRIFGSVRVATQQWQATGQPIYHWIDPVPQGHRATQPVLPLTVRDRPLKLGEVGSVALAEFEKDAFFGISDEIGDIKDGVRIIPHPDPMPLDSFNWPEHSATYYRHAVQLHSRYAGVITTAKMRSTTLVEATETKWAARTVVLAAPAVANITRPQVRAYFPTLRSLQNSPGSIAPVACVLAEPPFSQFGLADRIDADLKMINAYKFKREESDENEVKDDVLQLDQLRKEIGPDPLLSYFPVSDERSRAVTIAMEGPVGLHFDEEGTEQPIYSNSQFMLHIVAPKEMAASDATLAELEESFAGVSLTRYADPAWSWMPDDKQDDKTLSRFDASWIPITGHLELKAGNDAIVKVVHTAIDAKSNRLTISIAHSALFEGGTARDVTLYEATAEGFDAALLLRPAGDGRYALSVYKGRVQIEQVPGRGQPQLQASVIFKTSEHVVLSTETWRCRTRQSEASFVEWVRTGRDMAKVMTRVAAEPGKEENLVWISDLTAVLTPAGAKDDIGKAAAASKDLLLNFVSGGNEPLHVMSPVAARRYPLHVHRHLALVVRKPSRQIGHRVDLVDKVFLLDGGGGTRLEATPESSLLLAELETRAEILHVVGMAGETIPGLADFRHGYFDLVSSRSAPGTIRQMRFRFRAVNEPVDIATLTVVLHANAEINEPPAAVEIKIADLVKKKTLVRSFDLILYRNGTTPSLAITWPRGHAGDESPKPVAAAVGGLLDTADDITLTIKDAQGPNMPRWFDISLLHSAKERSASADWFDFDWMFGRPGGRLSLPQALAPQELNTLPEAQGRLIGLSEPIQLRIAGP